MVFKELKLKYFMCILAAIFTVSWVSYGADLKEEELPEEEKKFEGINQQTTESKYLTVFESVPEGTDIEVLLIGQTGSGKSTFVNTVANYILLGSFGEKSEDRKVKVIIPTPHLQPTEKKFTHSEHDVKNQAKSQTKKPKRYRLAAAHRTITFIDTPGMGDTDGIYSDDKHLIEILRKAAKGKKLSGIILFFNGAEPRDTATKLYTLNKIKSFIPNIALKNLIVVLTNTHKETSSFPIDQLKTFGVLEDNIFYMDNTLWASDPAAWTDPAVAHRLALDWDNSMTTVSNICTKLSASSGAINQDFKKMYEIRNFIMGEFHKVRLQFTEMQNAQDAIEAYRAKLQTESVVAENFRDFAQQAMVTTRKFVEKPSRHYSTICTVHHTICHDQCGLLETHTVGDEIFTGCESFNGSKNGSRCGACSSPDACSYVNHYHARGKFKVVEETLQHRLDEYKKRFEKANEAAQSAKADIDSAETALEQMKATITDFANNVKVQLEDLKKICSGYNFVAELNSTIELLKQEKQGLTSTEAINSATHFINELVLIADTLTEQSKEQCTTGDPYGGFGFGNRISAEEVNNDGAKALLSHVKGLTHPVSLLKGLKKISKK